MLGSCHGGGGRCKETRQQSQRSPPYGRGHGAKSALTKQTARPPARPGVTEPMGCGFTTPEKGVTSSLTSCPVWERGLVPGGDGTLFAWGSGAADIWEQPWCEEGQRQSASLPHLPTARGEDDSEPRVPGEARSSPLAPSSPNPSTSFASSPGSAADAVRLRSTWGSRALLLELQPYLPGAAPAWAEFWQRGQQR